MTDLQAIRAFCSTSKRFVPFLLISLSLSSHTMRSRTRTVHETSLLVILGDVSRAPPPRTAAGSHPRPSPGQPLPSNHLPARHRQTFLPDDHQRFTKTPTPPLYSVSPTPLIITGFSPPRSFMGTVPGGKQVELRADLTSSPFFAFSTASQGKNPSKEASWSG